MGRVYCACTAVRCGNRKALQAIVKDDPSVLFHRAGSCADNGEDGGTTLLHRVCDQGWNDDIAFLLSEILRHNPTHDDIGGNDNFHDGLFVESDLGMPINLLLYGGSDLEEILDYVRDHHSDYLKANLCHLPRIIAVNCDDMTVLSDLINKFGSFLLDSTDPKGGWTPLSVACYYQNENMIRELLESYRDIARRNKKNRDPHVIVRDHLLARNNDGTSPLGHLLLGVGSPDADNLWRCIRTVVRFLNENNNHPEDVEGQSPQLQQQRKEVFPVLHLFLSNHWQDILAKKNCMKVVKQIVDRLEIDVCALDSVTGNTVLSIVIQKLAKEEKKKKSNEKVSSKILDFILQLTSSTTRDGSGRLPLHLACEYSLPWKKGLSKIVDTHMPTLESKDPITGLPPFAHSAVGPKSDIDSIYELLRLHPDSMETSTR
jgi:ankyrin repeat protein